MVIAVGQFRLVRLAVIFISLFTVPKEILLEILLLDNINLKIIEIFCDKENKKMSEASTQITLIGTKLATVGMEFTLLVPRQSAKPAS